MMVLGNFQCRGVLLILFWISVGPGPTVLAVSMGGGEGGRGDIFSLLSFLFLFHLSERQPDID